MPAAAATSTKPNIIDHVSKSFRKRSSRSLKDALINGVTRKPVRARHFKALDDVSFVVKEGEALAAIGYNGSGKSQILKRISDVLEPDAGAVLTRGRVAGLIEVGARSHPDLTGRGDVFVDAAILGMSEKQTQARFNDIVAFSEIGGFEALELLETK